MSELTSLIDDMEIDVEFTGGEPARTDEGWDHHRWTGTLTYGGKTYSTDYRMGMFLTTPQADDFVYSVVSDALSYRNAPDLVEFSREFDYQDIATAVRAFEGCKEAYTKLSEVFTDAEFQRLADASH
ncbi:hypothetical protein SEA_EVAA_3 [Gordonia phage Evaa]|nr:hypothetical protein SEA_EVAA_3 [Gordonia phage Evaa]